MNKLRLPCLTADYVGDIAEKRALSGVVAGYYQEMYDETNLPQYRNIADQVIDCSASWFFDEYRPFYDLKSINLCHNRFCPNCQKLIQATRLYRFSPILDQYSSDHDIYHVVLTVPNVTSSDLIRTIDLMFSKFARLIRYMKCADGIRGIDFDRFGYVGAIRSLEVTYNIVADTYHPHLHCIFVLRKDLDLPKTHINQFSYHKGEIMRKFSDLELLLQKVWYLLMTADKVDLDAIKSVPDGYSCIADPVDGNYYEVFKYATKLFDRNHYILDYERFKVLYTALYKRRTIQGYGCLFGISCNDDIDDTVNNAFDGIILEAVKLGKPRFVGKRIDTLQRDLYVGSKPYISRKHIYQYLDELDEMKRAVLNSPAIENHEIVESVGFGDMPESRVMVYERRKRTGKALDSAFDAYESRLSNLGVKIVDRFDDLNIDDIF